jgi:hypothetical protein
MIVGLTQDVSDDEMLRIFTRHARPNLAPPTQFLVRLG